jgi:pyridoxine 4-dehydrogenase
MKEEGKIRHVGVSNVTTDHLARAQKIVPVVTVQNRYNLVDRADDAMIEICARQGIGYIPWAPLAMGEIARQGGLLDQTAKRHNATPGQIALAWLLQRSSNMLPIPGTSSVKHLEEDVMSATIKLTQEEFDALDRGTKP